MSPLIVTCRRVFGRLAGRSSTALIIALFWAAAGALFARALEQAEGGRQELAALWAVSIAPLLPLLAAFLAMDVWSGERRSGRLDLLLISPVRERDLAMGAFCGVLAAALLALVASLVGALGTLAFFAPSVLAASRLAAFAPALLALALQTALWCAVALAVSAMTRRTAASLAVTLLLLVGFPRGLWSAVSCLAPQSRLVFGEMPLDAQIVDFANGLVSGGAILSYLICCAAVLFVSSKALAATRFIGVGARVLRFSTFAVSALALTAAALTSALAVRLDMTVDLPVSGNAAFSPRIHHILSESSGRVTATCFLPRSDTRFRTIGHFLRALRLEAERAGGVRLDVQYVDPNWDLGTAERLVRRGAHAPALVFENARRLVTTPIDDTFGEAAVSSALQQLTMPPQRRKVCWTIGHGESRYDDYGEWGLSDMARELVREGYENAALDLQAVDGPPTDCALVIVAGAKEDFSRAELSRIDAYLRQGGRVLTLMNAPGGGGIAALLPTWGLRVSNQPLATVRTLSGTDVLVTDFADHPVTAPLTGTRILLERPAAFAPSSVVSSDTGADRLAFTALARVGTQAVVASVERGAGAGSDIAIRPTRIVLIGDATFVLNGPLAARANANGDLFRNAIAYLAGTDAAAASGVTADVLTLPLDRGERRLAALIGVAALPGAALVLMLVVLAFKRRKL